MNEKILTLLGFACKAGKLSYGFDAAVASLKKGNARLVLIAEDISQKSRKEGTFFAEKYNTAHHVMYGIGIQSVSDAVGKKCGVLSVNDEGFAAAIEKVLIEGGNANDEQI